MPKSVISNQKKITYVVNNFAFLISHRMKLIAVTKKNGFLVKAIAGQAGSELMENLAIKKLLTLKISYSRTCFTSSGMNPLIEIIGILQLIYEVIIFRPALVHCVSPKGVLYGGIVSRIAGIRSLVLAVSGMGYLFTSNENSSLTKLLLRSVYLKLVRFVLSHPNIKVIVQNEFDLNNLVNIGLVKLKDIEIISGSGVELAEYIDHTPFIKDKIVLLPSRMIADKGVREFVDAVKIIKRQSTGWRFILAGASDYSNPTAISQTEIETWVNSGIVEWHGYLENMHEMYKKAAIVCLPSYREGMPKVLLEAAASGCAVVTTDAIGCRDAIVDGVTGDLVPVGDANTLAKAIYALINDDNRRKMYGSKGQIRARELYSVDSVIQKTLSIYKELLNE